MSVKTILDGKRSWFLDSLSYDGSLVLTLQELKRGEKTTLAIGEVCFDDVYPLDASSDSMMVQVTFDEYIA